MAKGDDIVARKKNKANRKKQARKTDSSSVSSRVASIIAAKKRRKSGKRSKCQGMCFSLPTPDDPFNERGGKKDIEQIKAELAKACAQKKKLDDKKKGRSNMKTGGQEKNGKVRDLDIEPKKRALSLGEGSPNVAGRAKNQDTTKDGVLGKHVGFCGMTECPSKYLILCLNSIESALQQNNTDVNEGDKALFTSTWGNEFWKCYSVGKDVIESSGACSTTEQIAWIASTAADAIARKEKEGMSFTSLYFLFLVPSKEKAIKVRSMCKPLKALGVHTVSLHSEASLDHQISGLKSCEPEFLVATPERLLELVSLDAINISEVSMLVIDGLEDHSKDGYLDKIMSIKQMIKGNPYSVVFYNNFSHASFPLVRNLLGMSICRLSLHDSIRSQSAGILQSVDVHVSEQEKLSKVIKVLEQANGSELQSQPLKVLFIVKKGNKLHKLISALKTKGYFISDGPESEDSMDVDSEVRPAISMVDDEDISAAVLEEFEVVILPDFVLTIDNYIQILKRMARHTVRGVLQSFISDQDAHLVAPLIEVLEQCEQIVPDALKELCGR